MTADLATTNLMLGIMAVVSVLEGLLLLGVGYAAWTVYRKVSALVDTLEQRHVAPAMARVNGILDDVRGVTTTVKDETERVDQAIHNTIHRVDETVDRVRSTVRVKTSRAVGIVRGVRVALEEMMHPRPQPPADAPGQV